MTRTVTLTAAQERGNISLFVMLVLPVVLTLGVVTMDISAWQALRQRAQVHAQRIAFDASRFLPDTQRAYALITTRIAAEPGLEIATSDGGEMLTLTSSEINLTVRSAHESVFDAFLEDASGTSQIFVTYASARVSIVPRDTFLIVSDARTLRPDARTAWGSSGDWPASSYFNFIGQPSLSFDPPNEEPLHWPLWWQDDFNTELFQRWATQLCFNPVVSPIKFAAMSIADSLGSGSLHRLGVLFSPGDIPGAAGFSTGRVLRFPDEAAAATTWSSFYEARSASSDEACVYYADGETTSDGRYELPTSDASFVQSGTMVPCGDRIETIPFGDPIGHQPNPALGRLASCFTGGGATVQEALYFRAVRPYPHEPDAGNIARAVAHAYSQLILAAHIPDEESLSRRQNLATKTLRQIIVLTDTLPDPAHSSLQAVFSEAEDGAKHVRILFIAFQHPDLPASTKALNEARAASINAIGSSASAQLAMTAEELNRLAGSVIHRDRQLALRSS